MNNPEYRGNVVPIRPERPKNYTERLKNTLSQISDTINREVGISNLLNNDGTISMQAYEGTYTTDQIASDKAAMHKMEVEFSGANEPRIQEFHNSQYGIKTGHTE